MRTIRDLCITAAALTTLGLGGCRRPLPAAPPVVAGCTSAGPLAAPGDLPANLRPPAGAQLFLRLRAEGTQIYRCQKQPAGSWAFVLKAPDARLISDGCADVGHHFAGPRWSLARDGSVVIGKKLAEVARPGTIPWLLIAGSPEGIGGTMADVRFIQRVGTTGGAAPVEGCDEASAHREVAIPYRAIYLYYRLATPPGAAVSNSRS
jgi:hypothetical protein